MNVLLTCAGRRHYLARYFKDFLLNRTGCLVGTDMSLTAPALHACDKQYLVPSVYDNNYIDEIIKICLKENISYIFSVNDLELPILSKNKELIESKTNTTIVISNEECINICSDKYLTYKFCVENNIPAPKTYVSLENLKKDLLEKRIKFPIITKPRFGSASIGISIAHSLEEVEANFQECKRSVDNSILSKFGTCENNDTVIMQEYLNGFEYGIDILNSLSAEYIGFTAKRKISMRAGETDKAVTVSPTPFEESSRKISTHLQHVGNLDCDFIIVNEIAYLVEMNPRFGGGYPFTHEAGANHILHLLDTSPELTHSYSYAIGQGFSKCDHLVPFSE